MTSRSPTRTFATAFALVLGLAPFTAHADNDAPCAPKLRDALKIANTAPSVCETTMHLVPGQATILAIWDTDPDSPPELPLAAVLDEKALESGHKIFLYKRKAMGESISPFLFEGKTVNAAIGDFDGSGRPGFAMWIIPDADYFFAITLYDPKTRKFVEPDPNGGANKLEFGATDTDAMVRLSKGQVLVPICDPDSRKPGLYFNSYTMKNGASSEAKMVEATSATAAEQAKCKSMGQ